MQSPIKRKLDDEYDGDFVIPETPVASQSSDQQDMDIINQLFVEGIAHEEQWTLPSKKFMSDRDRELTVQLMQSKFSKKVPLLMQLPPEEVDSLKAALYNASDNWFYQIFEKEGYHPEMVAKCVKMWLDGEVNTLVLCGGNLTTAKMVFNAISSCFPMAVMESNLNSVYSIYKCSEKTSLYCVPYVDVPPTPIMLHLMEGNNTTCMIEDRVAYVSPPPMLIHCSDLSMGHAFLAKGISVFFFTQDSALVTPCYTPRSELRFFVSNCDSEKCLLTLHCKKENPLCAVCINKTRLN